MQECKLSKVAGCSPYAMQPCNSTDEVIAVKKSSVKSLAKQLLSRSTTAAHYEEISSSNITDMPHELKLLLGEDLKLFIDNPEAIESINQLFKDRQLMRLGLVPDSYCYKAYCDSCGEIPLYREGRFIMGCPWCLLGGYKKVKGCVDGK